MNETKQWYQSKTVWFNIVTVALAALPELIDAVKVIAPPRWIDLLVLVNTVGNIVLRAVTKTAITK